MSTKKPKVALCVAELFPPQGQWTEREYFSLPDTNRYLELSEGRLIMPPHPTRSHQVAVEELYIRLRAFVHERGLGEVHIAPLPVRLWPGKIREPDIFFIAKEHAERIGEQVCGVPDLVVEVLSPATRETDRGEKFFEYAKAGVQRILARGTQRNARSKSIRCAGRSMNPSPRWAEELALTCSKASPSALKRSSPENPHKIIRLDKLPFLVI
jgi:Uma2 family endonuclease